MQSPSLPSAATPERSLEELRRDRLQRLLATTKPAETPVPLQPPPGMRSHARHHR